MRASLDHMPWKARAAAAAHLLKCADDAGAVVQLRECHLALSP